MKILGREPAQLLAFVSAGLALLSGTLLPITTGQQGAIVAVLTALVGVATAAAVSEEKAAPLIAGLIQSVLSLALAFGADLTPGVQATIMSFAAAAVGLFLRTQVLAKVPAVVVDDPAA